MRITKDNIAMEIYCNLFEVSQGWSCSKLSFIRSLSRKLLKLMLLWNAICEEQNYLISALVINFNKLTRKLCSSCTPWFKQQHYMIRWGDWFWIMYFCLNNTCLLLFQMFHINVFALLKWVLFAVWWCKFFFALWGNEISFAVDTIIQNRKQWE